MAFGTTTSAYEMDGVGAVPYNAVQRERISASGAMNSAADQISRLQGIAQANNAFNASQAQMQRDWTERMTAKQMEFNASEAAKNRQWQEMLSNTAHQREIRDLKAAGLNPVLSAMNGNGASVGSGATASASLGSGSKADADTSTSGAIANLFGSILGAQTALQSANINARTQEAVADKYTAMEHIVAQIAAAAGIKQAGIHAGASRDAAAMSSSATRYAAGQAALASIFGSSVNSAATRYSADQHLSGTKYGADKSSDASKYASDKSFGASKYASDTNWDIKRTFGNGDKSSLAGMLAESIYGLFGGTYRKAK